MSKRKTTRRDFLKGIGLGATACAFGAAGPQQRLATARPTATNPFAAPGKDSNDSTGVDTGIPVTSHRIDVGDDPENAYSGAPQFDWSFFGERTRVITKYRNNYPAHRHSLGIDYVFYTISDHSFKYPPPRDTQQAILDEPIIPVIQIARIGKINRTEEDGERAHAYDLDTIKAFQKNYPNLIFGGGQTAEVDATITWVFSHYYGRCPVGPGGRVFPFAYFDFIESNLNRSSVPYMYQEHNQGWGIHYVARERAMSLSGSQLFYRARESIVPNLAAARSASRQYPHPFGVQFSGQLNPTVANATEVLENGAAPIYLIEPHRLGPNYSKSYALSRQMLYLSWLSGACFFRWETGEFIPSVARDFPSPLGTFTAKAAKLISDFGQTGPVQTPIAIMSEFSNAWKPPYIERNGGIDFVITGDSPYAPGDYQMHGLRDFFYPHCLQSEWVYEETMGEDYALVPTPYGNSIDFLLSDARKEALARYGLLVWGGVPPEAPSVVRDKLMWHITRNRGRVVLFGAAARSMFPEWFTDRPATRVAPGAAIAYGDQTLTESSDFLLEQLRDDLDTGGLSLKILATVGGKPLIVECLEGLVLVLSDYGTNRTEFLSPKDAKWHAGRMITDIPHKLLNHAKRLLDDEAARQTLLSVDNKNLHYIVTRPQRGEYILGLFNDKMNSQPFHITSNIGPITSIDEVELDDGKDALKSAVGGAAYAPPGLRNSPDLPLDYGLSDDKNIEGRDFRLFRIRVEESGVKDIPAIRYPNRPAGHVLAVAGLEHIRRYIQGISSFFQWFDGIRVNADALLSVDDAWLVEQAHWLDRRCVRIAVDGSGIDGEKASRVIDKLSLLKRAPRDLIIASPSQNLQTLAALRGVRLLDPSGVNRISKKGDAFNEEALLNIVDLYYKSEEDLYLDLRHFASRNDVLDLRGKRAPTGLNANLSIRRSKDVSDDFFYVGPYISSLKDVIGHYEAELVKFKGIKIDSTYLLSKTRAALAEDAATLARLHLEVIVDLRRDQMHFDRLAFYPHIPNYHSGMMLYEEIIDKMKMLDSKDLIIRIADVGDMRNKDKYIRQRDETWNTFAALAEPRNINLHLIFMANLQFSATADFSRPNVFVIEGSKGTPSPYALVLTTGTTGNGATKIYDENTTEKQMLVIHN